MATTVGDGRAIPKVAAATTLSASMGSVRPSAHAHAPPAAAHLSPLAEAAIRLLPGNDRCADCKAIYPQWAGVPFGILLCLACAGKHRALGVSVSFVKSLGMDSWSPNEQRALEMGGNAKWAAVCTGTATIDLAIAHKYTSPVAAAYKHRIQLLASAAKGITGGLTANEFLAQLVTTVGMTGGPVLPDDVASLRVSLPAPPPSRQQPQPQSQPLDQANRNEAAAEPSRVDSTDLVIKCTTCEREIPLHEINAHSKRCVVRAQTPVCWQKYDRSFGRANVSLGFSLTKTKGGFAEITRVTPGGDADTAGVTVGSYVVGLNDQRTSAFKEIVALVGSLARPIHFHFVCRSLQHDGAPLASDATETARLSVGSLSMISSVPEPVTVETHAVFDESVREIGCVLQVQNNRCVVTAVDDDSAAQQQGILVGSCVVAVNGRLVLHGLDAIEAIQKSSRPLRIKFHRVEGLMRGWKAS